MDCIMSTPEVKIVEDVVLVLAYLKCDNKFAVINYEKYGFGLPFKTKAGGMSYKETAKLIVQELAKEGLVIKLSRLSVTEFHTEAAVATTAIYFADIIKPTENKNISWYTFDEIKFLKKQMSDQYLLEFFSEGENLVTGPVKYAINNPLLFYNKLSSSEKALLEQAEIHFQGVRIVFYDIMKYIYPSESINLKLFTDYINSLQFNDNCTSPEKLKYNIKDLFRSFNVDCSGFLSFNDLIIGLAAFNCTTPHDQESGTIRCKCIFRLYDRKSEGLMQPEDFMKLIKDVLKIQKVNCELKINMQIHQYLDIFRVKYENQLSFENFSQIVVDYNIDIRNLFRSPEPILCSILRKYDKHNESVKNLQMFLSTNPSVSRDELNVQEGDSLADKVLSNEINVQEGHSLTDEVSSDINNIQEGQSFLK